MPTDPRDYMSVEDKNEDGAMAAKQHAEEHPPPREAVESATAFVETIFTDGGGEKADRLVLTQDRPSPRSLGGWSRGPIVDRVARAFARYHAEGESSTVAELRGLIAECLALNPTVSGDMDKVRVWVDVLRRMKSEAARHAPEAEGE